MSGGGGTVEGTGRRLLVALAEAGGELPFEDARRAVALSAQQLRVLVRDLDELVAPVQVLTSTPDYRITPQGRAQVDLAHRRHPDDRLTLTLWTRPGVADERLCVEVRRDGRRTAGRVVPCSSYQLATIRYALSLAPGGLPSDIIRKSSLLIGRALLPPCDRCAQLLRAGQPLPECADPRCVLGVVLAALDRARRAGRWLAIDLDVRVPWNHVPWELAAWDFDRYLALDAASLRRVPQADDVVDMWVDGDPVVLVATPVTNPADAKVFADEAEDVRRFLEVPGPDGRRYVPHVRLGFTGAAELAKAIDDLRPRIVHIAAHGSTRGLGGVVGVLPKAELAAALARDPVDLVVLGSCFGATDSGIDLDGSSLARMAVQRGVARVVAFDGRAEARHVRAFGEAFYAELAGSGSADQAVRCGRRAMNDLGTAYCQLAQVSLFAGAGRAQPVPA